MSVIGNHPLNSVRLKNYYRKITGKVIRHAFNDFRKEILNANDISNLASFTFESGLTPDYNLSLFQQFYVLRYYQAYLIEYIDLYKNLLNDATDLSGINVLSIGSGCGIDYSACEIVINHIIKRNISLSYTGVDKVNWNYKVNENTTQLLGDIKDIEFSQIENVNIIIFPKSLSEFSNEAFSKLATVISATKFASKKLFIAGSFRIFNIQNHVERFNRLINILNEKYEIVLEHSRFEYINEGDYIINEFPFYIVDKEIDNYLTNVFRKCGKYVNGNKKHCHNKCEESIHLWPIKKNKFINYKFYELRKIDDN